MTLLERLKLHRGEIIQVKTAVSWYCGKQSMPGEICLLLDVDASHRATTVAAASFAIKPNIAVNGGRLRQSFMVLLLLKEKPQWIFVDEEDVDLIGENQAAT